MQDDTGYNTTHPSMLREGDIGLASTKQQQAQQRLSNIQNETIQTIITENRPSSPTHRNSNIPNVTNQQSHPSVTEQTSSIPRRTLADARNHIKDTKSSPVQHIQIPERAHEINVKPNYFKSNRTVFDKNIITCMGVIMTVVLLLTLLALLFMLPIPLVYKQAPYTMKLKYANGTYTKSHYSPRRHLTRDNVTTSSVLSTPTISTGYTTILDPTETSYDSENAISSTVNLGQLSGPETVKRLSPSQLTTYSPIIVTSTETVPTQGLSELIPFSDMPDLEQLDEYELEMADIDASKEEYSVS